jgi:hypothetical protein
MTTETTADQRGRGYLPVQSGSLLAQWGVRTISV